MIHGFISSFAALGLAVLLLVVPALSQDTALVLNVEPLNGGSVNISSGVHNYETDSEVTLIATPKPGYQFVYWLGNVTDSVSNNTMVLLDSPKIVIAVFERSKFDLLEFEEQPEPSVGGGGLRASGGDYSAALEQADGGQRPRKFNYPRTKPDDDVPVPDDTGNLPVPDDTGELPVPEPATILFTLAGMLSLIKYRHKK